MNLRGQSLSVTNIAVTEQNGSARTPETAPRLHDLHLHRFLAITLLLLLILLVSTTTHAQISSIKNQLRPKPSPAATSLEAYLERVRAYSAAQPASGSIWNESGRLTRMMTDVRAMRPHDLISVVVSESLAASTDGTVKNSRASNANSQVSSLFGALHAGNALQNLVAQTSSAALDAQGTSATNSSLSTTLGGQVIEVLPNGMLVIEAARQVEFSQQTHKRSCCAASYGLKIFRSRVRSSQQRSLAWNLKLKAKGLLRTTHIGPIFLFGCCNEP